MRYKLIRAIVGWVSSIERNPTIEAIATFNAVVLGYGYRLIYMDVVYAGIAGANSCYLHGCGVCRNCRSKFLLSTWMWCMQELQEQIPVHPTYLQRIQ
jgi:hypothetical protein